MKALKKMICALLVPFCAFAVSCTNDDTTDLVGAPDVQGCYGVYFPEQENVGNMEIDPADALDFTYTVSRKNADGAITVPVVIEKNTDDMFSVTPIEFADGEDETTFTVTLSDESALGEKYSFALVINDPQYVSQYAENSVSVSLGITRVKWNDVGECDYTEDVLTGWWNFSFDGEYAGITHPTYKVKVQVRADSVADLDKYDAALAGTGSDEDLAGTYRLVNPYRVGPWEDPADTTLETDPDYIYIYIPSSTTAYIPLQEIGWTINGGMPSIYSMAAYRLDNGRTPSADEYGYIKNGKLLFPIECVLGCPGGSYVGTNTYYANNDGAFCLNIAPALNQYELVLPDPAEGTDGDFTFADVTLPDGTLFYSESLLQAWEQNLQVGTPAVNTDDADKLFEETYGKLYRLPNLFADYYDIYFCVKDGKVVLPADFETQETGLSKLSQKLSIAINASKSEFNEATNEVSLSTELISADGKLSFGNFSEVLSATVPDFEVAANLDLARDFNYTTQFNDTFKSGIVGDSWKTDFQSGTATDSQKGALFEAAYGKAYCLPNLYKPNYNIYFCGKDGEVSVPANYQVQPTGLEMFGTKIYATVVSGTVGEFGATLRIQFADESGDLILGTYTESIVTYNWLEVATGTYTSIMYRNPFSNITMSQAEGTDLYRLENFVGAGKHLEFYWNSSTNKCELNGIIGSGEDYDGNGNEMMVVDAKGYYNDLNGNDYSWALLEANNFPQPSYDPATLTFSMYVKWVIPTLGLGTSFGTETFVLDAAPVVSTWEDVAVGTFTHNAPFFFASEYPEEGLTLQRFGTTDKYKVVGLAEGTMDLVFTHNAESGSVKVLENDTNQVYQETDGSLTPIYCGDAWAGYSAWISAGLIDPSQITEEMVYSVYQNSYDDASKTYTFSLMYYDHFGYTYTGQESSVWAQTFQITGDAPAAGTASVKARAEKKVVSNSRVLAKEVNAAKATRSNAAMQVSKFATITDKPVSCRKSAGKGLAGSEPVKRGMERNIEQAAL
jgi:lipoprotein